MANWLFNRAVSMITKSVVESVKNPDMDFKGALLDNAKDEVNRYFGSDQEDRSASHTNTAQPALNTANQAKTVSTERSSSVKENPYPGREEIQAMAYAIHSGQFGRGENRIKNMMAEGYSKADIALAQSVVNNGMDFCASMTDAQYKDMINRLETQTKANNGVIESVKDRVYGDYDGTVPAGAKFPDLDDVRTRYPGTKLQSSVSVQDAPSGSGTSSPKASNASKAKTAEVQAKSEDYEMEM